MREEYTRGNNKSRGKKTFLFLLSLDITKLLVMIAVYISFLLGAIFQ